jgi:hypothetical protein
MVKYLLSALFACGWIVLLYNWATDPLHPVTAPDGRQAFQVRCNGQRAQDCTNEADKKCGTNNYYPLTGIDSRAQRTRLTWSGLITEPVSFFDYTFTCEPPHQRP